MTREELIREWAGHAELDERVADALWMLAEIDRLGLRETELSDALAEADAWPEVKARKQLQDEIERLREENANLKAERLLSIMDQDVLREENERLRKIEAFHLARRGAFSPVVTEPIPSWCKCTEEWIEAGHHPDCVKLWWEERKKTDDVRLDPPMAPGAKT